MNSGAFGENFPYSNFHDLNMDWIIKIAKDFLDQYTHIQQIIENGETSLENLTTEGLQQLQEKADALEALLQAWYNEHSEDIAEQLSDALSDLNDWYTEHEGFLDQYVTDSIALFRTEATEIGNEVRASIPSDYSTLSDTANYLYNKEPLINVFNKDIQFLDNTKWVHNKYYALPDSGIFELRDIDDPIWAVQSIIGLPAGTYYYNNVFDNFTIIQNTIDKTYAKISSYQASVVGSETAITINHPFNIFITINVGYDWAMFATNRLPGTYIYGIYPDEIVFKNYVISLQTALKTYGSGTIRYLLSNTLVDCRTKTYWVNCKNTALFNAFYLQIDDNDTVTLGFQNNGTLPIGYRYYVGLTNADASLPVPTEADTKYISVIELNKNPIIVDANTDKSADFAHIKDAIEYASNDTTIYIKNGTYNEDVDMRTKRLTLIGENPYFTRIEMYTDLYSQPPLEAAKGYIKNITFYVDNTQRPTETSEDHAYAVHVDFNQEAGERLIFENCRLISTRMALGLGTRRNFTISFFNCYFESKESFAIFMHNSNNQELVGAGQHLVLDNCKVYSANSECIVLQTCYDTDNNADISSYNTLYVANGVKPTQWNTSLPHVGTGNSIIVLAPASFGNNASFMNGSLS